MLFKTPYYWFFLAIIQSITLISLAPTPGYSSDRLQKLLEQPQTPMPVNRAIPSPPERRQEKSSSLLASPEQLTQLRQIFSDVNSSQWAYESIQSLAIRFGCLVGYPDNTFRGDQKLSRNEFAAGLNRCLDKIDSLMQQRTENLVTKEQLAELFRVLSDIFDKNPQLRKVPNSENNSSPTPPELAPVLPPVTEPSKQR